MTENKTSLVIIGTSIDEAVAQGAEELGLPPEALDVEVLDEGSKGLFGLGKRQVRVRLTVSTTSTETETRVRKPEAPPQEGDEEAVRVAHETVSELLQRMGIRATVEAEWGEVDERGRIRPLLVDIRGDDLSILIGRRGETLSALQYITRLIIGKELKRPVSVIIDVEGYRSRREQQLRRLARRMAQQAIETGRTTSLEPMPANERRIIHIELRNDPKVNTLSVGEGDRRKVTIVPVD
jgi:spoIIIJ-associated protein